MAEEEPSPVDQLIDLFVYAPVGLLYEYDEVLPKLDRRGKSQVQLARVIGKMAMNQGGSESFNQLAEGLAMMVARRITEIGESMGLAPPSGEDAADEPVEDAADEPDEIAPPSPAVAVGTQPPLPIAGYDDLTAREIVALLDELEMDQLARVRAHEEANRGRKTVLGKLERLGA